MNTSHVFIPICYFCRQLINLGTPFFLVGVRDRVHAKCLEQWKNDDPLEWEGQPDPVKGA